MHLVYTNKKITGDHYEKYHKYTNHFHKILCSSAALTLIPQPHYNFIFQFLINQNLGKIRQFFKPKWLFITIRFLP